MWHQCLYGYCCPNKLTFWFASHNIGDKKSIEATAFGEETIFDFRDPFDPFDPRAVLISHISLSLGFKVFVWAKSESGRPRTPPKSTFSDLSSFLLWVCVFPKSAGVLLSFTAQTVVLRVKKAIFFCLSLDFHWKFQEGVWTNAHGFKIFATATKLLINQSNKVCIVW